MPHQSVHPIQRVARATLPTRYGDFAMSVYDSPTHKEHVALTIGAINLSFA